ncbi:MAG TPA: DUF2000 domain-containing protein [Trebonia sp.]|jgi:hypothetical protein|nr:DUF2000 domain-containing protein [Trebonia sp.]
MAGQTDRVKFDTKIAIAVQESLAAWQKLNVTAFLASAVADGAAETIGEPYADADGTAYLPMFRQPVLVYAADAAALTRVRGAAVGRGLAVAVYIEEMFKTGHDEANRAAVAAVAADDLPLVGLAVYGPRNAVDKVMKGLPLHP